MQVILDSLFARPGSAAIGDGKKGEFRDWTRSTVVSLLVILLAGLLTFMWVMYLNVGNNNNIFLCHGDKECFRK